MHYAWGPLLPGGAQQQAGGTTWFSTADLALAFTFDTNGVRTTFSSATFPITVDIVTAGSHTAIGSTIGRNLNFDFVTNGVRATFSSVTLPIVLDISTSGARASFGSVTFPVTFGIDTAGALYKRGAVDLPLTFAVDTAGKASHFATVTMPLTFTFSTDGVNPDAVDTSEPLKVDREDLKREPWPGFPDLPKPRVGKPAKPGYMKRKKP